MALELVCRPMEARRCLSVVVPGDEWSLRSNPKKMIYKSKRYPLRTERSIFSKGKRARGSLVEISSLPSSASRRAVIVGKNVSLKAVERNLVKRRISEALEKTLAVSNLNLDVVARALPAAKKATYVQLETEIGKLLSGSNHFHD